MAACSILTTSVAEGDETGISLPCLTGKRTVDVESLGGRRTVVNLWAGWCTVCRKEVPVLESAYRARDGEVQFVGVDTLDETAPAADFQRRTGVSYPQLYTSRANC